MSDRTMMYVGMYADDREHVRKLRDAHRLSNDSEAVRFALRECAQSIGRTLPGTPVASYGAPPVPVPERSQAWRLAAMRTFAGLSQQALAALLGYGHRSSVGNVELGRAPLDGALLAWVEEQEKAAAK